MTFSIAPRNFVKKKKKYIKHYLIVIQIVAYFMCFIHIGQILYLNYPYYRQRIFIARIFYIRKYYSVINFGKY